MKSLAAIVIFAALAHCATAIIMETPEVAAARAAHLEAVRKATVGEFELPKTDLVPVMDSPEVAAARAAHLEAVRKATVGEFELPKADLVPVTESPEVAAARVEHLDAFRKAQAGIFELPKADLMPVTETPEVSAARIDHLNRYNYEALRNSLLPSRYLEYAYAHQPIVYSYNAAPVPPYNTGFIPYYGF